MNIGIINSFSHRPHNQHLVYLGGLLSKLDYKVFYANCSGGAASCNTLITKKVLNSRSLTCFLCKKFGLKALVNTKVVGLSPKGEATNCPHSDLALSTLFTSSRTETPDEVKSIKEHEQFSKLKTSCSAYYNSVQKWVKENEIDMVFGYNGRLDLLRAARFAVMDLGKVFWTVERPWFGRGLLVIPDEGPLGTSSLEGFAKLFMDKPLTHEQAIKALEPVAKRRFQVNRSEFMNFNKGHKLFDWQDINPRGEFKYLFLPSSRMEHLSEFKYGEDAWSHPLDCLEVLIEKDMIKPEDLIIRFHPIWGVKIFNQDASSCVNYYKDFCHKHKIKYIREDEKISTSHLISQADIVFSSGGSSFFEASVIGKPVVSLSKAFYDCSNYQFDLHDRSHLEKIDFAQLRENKDRTEKVRVALRFLYLFQFRYNQFTDEIFHLNSYEPVFKISESATSHLNMLCEQGILIPFDSNSSENKLEENEIIEKIVNNTFAWADSINTAEDFEEFDKIEPKSIVNRLIFNHAK